MEENQNEESRKAVSDDSACSEKSIISRADRPVDRLIADLSEQEKGLLVDNFYNLPYNIQKIEVRRIKRFRDPEHVKALECKKRVLVDNSPVKPSGLKTIKPV